MRKVAIIPSVVGYHWEEIYGAYSEFKKAGWTIDLYTVNGQAAVADPKSLENRPLLSLIGLGLNQSISPETELGREIEYRLSDDVMHIDRLTIDQYDALYIPGGHGCLFDVNINLTVQRKVVEAFQKRKVISAVCHGTSTLALSTMDGKSIIEGKKVTGFPDFMDDVLMLAKWIPEKFLPLPLRNEKTMKTAGADITWFNTLMSIINPFYKRTDGQLITGMGPKASYGVARNVVKLVEQQKVPTAEKVLL
jgi:putative intracellular protease/amidase